MLLHDTRHLNNLNKLALDKSGESPQATYARQHREHISLHSCYLPSSLLLQEQPQPQREKAQHDELIRISSAALCGRAWIVRVPLRERVAQQNGGKTLREGGLFL